MPKSLASACVSWLESAAIIAQEFQLDTTCILAFTKRASTRREPVRLSPDSGAPRNDLTVAAVFQEDARDHVAIIATDLEAV
jgi:hypothetical protein